VPGISSSREVLCRATKDRIRATLRSALNAAIRQQLIDTFLERYQRVWADRTEWSIVDSRADRGA
jgi:hypothetical protein